jgi:hypothetical protein
VSSKESWLTGNRQVGCAPVFLDPFSDRKPSFPSSFFLLFSTYDLLMRIARISRARSQRSSRSRALPTEGAASAQGFLDSLANHRYFHASRPRYAHVSALALRSRFPGAPARRCRVRFQRPPNIYSLLVLRTSPGLNIRNTII